MEAASTAPEIFHFSARGTMLAMPFETRPNPQPSMPPSLSALLILTFDRQGMRVMPETQDEMRWRFALRGMQDRGNVYASTPDLKHGEND